MNLPSFESRRIIGYGAGLAALTTIETSGLKCELLVDRSPALHGQQLCGVPIDTPARLDELIRKENRDEFFVVVCAYENRAISAIFKHLSQLGLAHGKHYTDASVLHFKTIAAKLRGALAIAADPLRFESVRALTLFTSLDNKSSIAGTWLLQELLHRQLSTVAGDIAEAGVYTGGNACLTLTLATRHLGGRNYHLLDSFAGFPEFSSHDPQSRSGEFRDVSFGSIRDLFSHFECARLHVGFFAQTLPSLADHTFALAYIDCDCYEPTLECCEFFYPRMPAGGMILFHDYWHPRPGLPPGTKEPFTGVAKAADEFAAAMGETIVVFPETTHALLIKGRS